MAKLFANSGDPDQTPHSGSALFANGLIEVPHPGEIRKFQQKHLIWTWMVGRVMVLKACYTCSWWGGGMFVTFFCFCTFTSIPGRVIPKTLKMVQAALSLGAQH